ncbi:hypothetical protein T07_7562 [Trichinella nelsoni]|uniref:Uncharacterized protein n=1 Tax=Trichinella nelsoni TaxID=6336 RepID=A0A0V0RZX9_9BILA|nr:hypothetical protein T07_7562 [Trichinella nelsoni]
MNVILKLSYVKIKYYDKYIGVTTRWAGSSGSLPPGPLQFARYHSWPARLRSRGLVSVLPSSTFVSSQHSHSTLVHLLTVWSPPLQYIEVFRGRGGTGVGQLKFDPSIVLLTIPRLAALL